MGNKKDYLKYCKMTMAYSNSKIWYLLLLALLPSVFISFMFSPYGSIKFFCDFAEFYQADFGKMYLIVSGINIRYYYLGIIGITAVPMILSVLFGAVERHMRTGDFNLGFNRVRSRLDYNFLAALKFSAALFAVYQLFKFLQVIVFYLLCRTMVMNWAFALSLVWYAVLFVAEIFLLSAAILWVPTMLQTGLNSTKALGLSVRQGVRYSIGTIMILLIPTLPMMACMIADAILNLRIDIVLNTILLTITSVFYVVLMYTMFFDINGIQREDLNKVNIWKKRKHKSKRNKNGN